MDYWTLEGDLLPLVVSCNGTNGVVGVALHLAPTLVIIYIVSQSVSQTEGYYTTVTESKHSIPF